MPEFNDLVSRELFGDASINQLPLPGPNLTPVNYVMPKPDYDFDRFGLSSTKGTGNPLGDALNGFENQSMSLDQQIRPINFDGEAMNVDRYRNAEDFQRLGVDLDGSNEERYGQNQSWGEVMSNGFAGLTRLASNGFVDNWKGFGRMFDAMVTMDWSKLYGDAESMLALDNEMRQVMDENAIFATEEGTNTFWNRETAGNFLQQSGFAVGAAVGMLSEQLLTKAVEAGLAATGVGAGAAVAIEAATTAQTAANIGRWARVMNRTKEFYDAAKNFKALKKMGDIWKDENMIKNLMVAGAKKLPGLDMAYDMYRVGQKGGTALDIAKVGAGGLKRLISEANFAFTEARMEAAGTYSDLYSQMMRQAGPDVTEEQISNIERLAMEAADSNFNFNTAVLAISNRIQFDNIFKNSKVTRGIMAKYGLDDAVEDRLKVVGNIGDRSVPHYYETGFLGGAGKKAFKQVSADFGKAKAYQVMGGSLLKNLGKMEVSEGIQELLQEGSNEYFKDYYKDAYAATTNPELGPDSSRSFSKAVDSQLNMQGFKTFASGALTGLLLRGPSYAGGKALEYGNEKITDYTKTKTMTEAEKTKYYEQKAERKSESSRHYEEFNAFAKDPSKVLSESIKNMNFQKEGATALMDAANAGDIFAYENIRTEMLHKMIAASVRNNTYEGLIDTLRGYGENMSKEEFEKAFVSVEYSSQNKTSAKDYTDKIAGSVESYVKTYNKLQERYGSKANPNRYKFGTPEFLRELIKKKTLDDMIETLAGNELKATDALERATGIFKKISSNKNMGASLANAYNVLGNEATIVKETTVLEQEIRLKQEQLKADIPAAEKENIRKELAVKEEQLQHLKDWSINKTEILNEAKVDKSLKAFKGYVESKNKEAGREQVIDQKEADEHFLDLIDYIKLNEKSGRHMEAINMLANPTYFENIHTRMQEGAKDAYINMLGVVGADHVKKTTGDNKSFILELYGEFVLFDKDGVPVSVHPNMAEARKAKVAHDAKIEEAAKAEAPPKPDAPRLTIKVKDKNGAELEQEIIEGHTYITESEPVTRVMPNRKRVKLAENDILKIVKVDPAANTITFTMNGEAETYMFQADEFAEASGKLYDLAKLTLSEQIYFKNRTKKITFRVSKVYGTPHSVDGIHKNRDYSYNSVDAEGMLRLVKEDGKWVLKVEYRNPITKKVATMDYSDAYMKKYGVGKSDLSLNPTEQEYIEFEREERTKRNLAGQLAALELMIKEAEDKMVLRRKRREEIDQEIEESRAAVKDMEETMELAQMYLDDLKGSRKKGVKALREQYTKMLETIPGRISKLKETAAKLQQEKLDIDQEMQVIKESMDLYMEGLIEIDNNKAPFVSGVSGSIIDQDQQRLENAQQNQVAGYISAEQFDDVLLNIEVEMEQIDGKLSEVLDTIKTLENTLAKLLKYDELIKTIYRTSNTSDKSLKNLRANLTSMKMKERNKENPDKEMIAVIDQMLSGLGKTKSLAEDIIQQDLLEAIAMLNVLRDSKQELIEMLERRAQLQDKFDEYEIGKKQASTIKELSDRIAFLQKLEVAIKEGYRKYQAINRVTITAKSVTAVTKEAAGELAQYADIMSTEPVFSGDESEDMFLSDFDKPLLSEGGLFKTADRHYMNDTDATPNTPQAARFFRFSETVNIDGTYYFIPVSKAGDTMGITVDSYEDNNGNSIAVTGDIKMMVVKKVGNEFKPVGVDGKVLDNPTTDTVIYTSMPNNPTITGGTDAQVLEFLKGASSPFTVTGLTDEQILSEVKKFRAFRSNVLSRTEKKEQVPLKITGKSKGIQRREPLDQATDRPQELSLHGRLIVESPKYFDLRHPDGSSVELEVVTKKNSASKRIKPGRLVLVKRQGNTQTEFQVYNRQLTEDEKTNLFDVILAVLPMFGRKNAISKERQTMLGELFESGKITSDQLVRLTTPLSETEDKQFDMAMQYIISVLNWRQLKAGETADKSQFYLSKGALYVGDKAYRFEIDGQLDLSVLEAARDEIMAGLYHNVNNKKLENSKERARPFVTVKVQDGKIVEDKSFSSYTEYLLTNKKDGHTPVVYTNIKPYAPVDNVNEPQLKNVYLMYEGFKETQEVKPAAPAATAAAASNIVQTATIDNIPVGKEVAITRINDAKNSHHILVGKWNGTSFIISNVLNAEGVDVTQSLGAMVEKLGTDMTNIIKNLEESRKKKEGAGNDLSNAIVKQFHEDHDAMVATVVEKYTKVQVMEQPEVKKPEAAQGPIHHVTNPDTGAMAYAFLNQTGFSVYFNTKQAAEEAYAKMYNPTSGTAPAPTTTKRPAATAPAADKKADVKGNLASQGTSIELEVIGETGKEFLLTVDRSGNISLWSEKQPDGTYRPGEGAPKEAIDKLYNKYIPEKTRTAVTNWLNAFTGSWAASETEDGKKYDIAEKELKTELAALQVAKPTATAAVNNTQNIFEEVREAHYGSFIYQLGKYLEEVGLTAPEIYGNDFNAAIKKLTDAKGLSNIVRSALLSRLQIFFENRLVNGNTDVQGLVTYINDIFKISVKIDSSAYDALSQELRKLDDQMAFNVMGNESLSNAEKLQKGKELTLLRNKWYQESTNIINRILSQVDSSIPKLEPRKATKENTPSISNYDRKETLDNFVANLKAKNKNSDARVMAVLNKYGIAFEDFIQNIEAYYKQTTPVAATAPAETNTATFTPTTPYGTPTGPELKTAISNADALAAAKAAYAARQGKTSPKKGNYRLAMGQATEREDIAAFREWMNRVLPQIAVQTADRLIDGRAWGKFVNGVIKIYQNAGKGTGFHEAFEAVWNTYLTETERMALISEFQSRKGKFTNPFTKQRKDYRQATAYDVKEMLAEEFIDYMRSENGVIVEGAPKRNTLFRRFLNMIKKLWNNIQQAFGIIPERAEDGKINEIFRKISSGGFANAVADTQNIVADDNFRFALDTTSVEFTQKLMEGMAGYFFVNLYSEEDENGRRNNIKSLFDASKPQLFEKLYEIVKDDLINTFGDYYDSVRDSLVAAGMNDEQIDDIMANDPDSVYRNIAISKLDTEVKQLFKKYVSQFGLKFKETKLDAEQFEEIGKKDEAGEIITPDELERNDRLGLVEAMYLDPRDMTKAEVKLLIASLTSDQYDEDGVTTYKVNELGLPILEDFGRKINILLNELHSTVPVARYNPTTKTVDEVSVIDQMFDKLDKRFRKNGDYKPGYEWIAKLKRRLNYEDTFGQKRNIADMTKDEVNLLLAFETSFTNNRNIPNKVIIGPDGMIYSDNTIDSTNAKRIKEDWQNNVKFMAKPLGSTKEQREQGPAFYIDANGMIRFNHESKELQRLMGATNATSMLDSLRALGFDFTASNEDIVLEFGARDISDTFSSIVSQFTAENINTFDDLFGKQIVNGPVNYFINVERFFTADDTILSTRNAEGKQQYSITMPSAISHLMNSFKAVSNLRDFVLSNPHLGQVDLNTGEIKLNTYSASSLLLKPGGLLFDETGDKLPNAKLEYRYVLGMASQSESTGTSTDRLEYPDKVTQEIYHIMDGTYFTVINSDKSSEFGVNFGHAITYGELYPSIEDNKKVIDMYRNALKDELMTASFESRSTDVEIKEYSKSVMKLGHFSKIINVEENPAMKALFEKYLADDRSGVANAVDSFINNVEVEKLLINYLANKVNDNMQWLKDLGIVKESEGSIKTTAFSREQIQNVTDGAVSYKEGQLSNAEYRRLVMFMTFNRQLAVFEQHKLLYGHPAMYKDLAKRSSGINSQKQPIAENSNYLSWLDRNMPRYDGKRQRTNTFKFISHSDPKAVSRFTAQIAEGMYESMKKAYETKGKISATDKKKLQKIIGVEFDDAGKLTNIKGGAGTLIDPYINAEEPDGAAYIMPDFFRDMHFLSGKYNDGQVELLDYENALETLDRMDNSHPSYNVPGFAITYNEAKREKAQKIVDAYKTKYAKTGNSTVLQVLKPQGFGYQVTEGRTHTSLLKHSVVPLTWSRVINNPNMLGKYLQAQDDNVDIMGFESGQKVGVITKKGKRSLQNIYDENGKYNDKRVPVQEMYTKYYGFQVEMASYVKNEVIFGSQMRKINLANLPAELRPFAEEYNRLIDAQTQSEFEGVLNQLGLRQEGEDYVTDDLGRMIDTLRSEVERRDLPDNIVDMLVVMTDQNGNQTLQYRFDASPIREKLDNILNAIVDNRILAQTMFGKASVQVPSTMFEQSDRLFTYKQADGTYAEPVKASDLTKEQRKIAKMVSSDLAFYDGKDGSYMEVMLPHYFKGILPENINLAELDPRLLKVIGFRIPSQGMNSIETIRIKGFLDPQWGDMVVVPTEMVAKSGSDFDIDKLNLFLANYYIDRKTGQPKYVEYSTSDDELNDRYVDYVNSSVNKDTKRYVQAMEKQAGIKEGLKQRYQEKKDDILKKFNETKAQNQEDYIKTEENIMRLATRSKGSDATIIEYKREGTTLFNTLPIGIKQPFYDLKDSGVLSIAENKALAERLLQANPDARYASTLMQMIQYHDAMLDVYAQINSWTEQQLQNLKDRATVAFDNTSNFKESGLQAARSEFIAELRKQRFEYTEELARVSNLLTLDQFSKLSIEQQNSKEARQNKLIELMDNILGSQKNYRQMVVPNGADTLKKLANDIRDLKKLPSADTDRTSLSEWKTMTEVRERYVTGKKLVGVIALQITSHALSQYGDIEMTGYYMEDGKKVDIKVRMNTNTPEGKFMLNLIEDKGYKWISELLSEAMTGAVDAAKDPFIFDLNLTLKTASTWFFLQKLGVEVEDIAYLHVQPLVENYFTEIGKNSSLLNTVNETKLGKAKVRLLAMEPYLKKAFPDMEARIKKSIAGEADFRTIVEMSETPKMVYDKEEETYYDENAAKYRQLTKIVSQLIDVHTLKTMNGAFLKSMIKPTDKDTAVSQMTQEEALNQILVLDEYLMYQEQAGYLDNFVRALSYDTSRTKNIMENELQKATYQKAVDDEFITPESLERLMNSTFLGKMKEIKDSVPAMFKNFFVTVHPKSRPVMEKALDTILADKYMSNEEKVELLNRYQNFFLNYLLHTGKIKVDGAEFTLNNYYKQLFMGNNSVAKQLKRMQEKYLDNKALNNLFAMVNTDTRDTDNIKLFNSKLSSYEINSIGESLLALKQTALATNDQQLLSFTKQLSIFVIAQSGVQQSPISYTKVMPIEIYSQTVADLFDSYLSNDDFQVDPEIVWRQFHQNNYKNSKLVDIVKYKSAFGAGVKNFKNKGEFVTVRYYKPEVVGRKDLQEQLIKNKDWDAVFEYILYQKLPQTDKAEVPRYVPINKLGDGMYMIEASNQPYAESVLIKNGKIDMTGYMDYINEANARVASAQLAATMTESPYEQADRLPPIEQNLKDGQGGRKMQPKFAGKSTMDLIKSGDRTRTTRAKTDIKRMINDYGLSKIEDLVGRIIRMTDKKGTTVYTEIVNVSPFTQEYQDATWQKEGWEKTVTDANVGDYPYAIEFRVVADPLNNGIKEFIKLRFGDLQGKELVDAMLEDKKEMFEDTIRLFKQLNPSTSEEELNKGIEDIKNTYNYISLQPTSLIKEVSSSEIDDALKNLDGGCKKK